jgi:hypothetical protein
MKPTFIATELRAYAPFTAFGTATDVVVMAATIAIPRDSFILLWIKKAGDTA